MSKPSTDEPGNHNADWYMQLFGVDPQSPSTLGDVARTEPATQTSELVTEMWEQTAEQAATTPNDALSDWAPNDLDRTVRSRRQVRWGVVFTAIAVGLSIAFFLWWFPQASRQRAVEVSQRYEETLANAYADLGTVQGALAIATEPSSDMTDLSDVAIELAAAADSSTLLLEVSNEPIPKPLPFTSNEPFESLEVSRARMEPLAAEATAIRDEIVRIADYRLAFFSVLSTEELPLTADTATVTALGAALAKVLADSVGALSAMPTEGPFAEHRALVADEITEFAQWQNDYLESLRSGDSAEASRLAESLRETQQHLGDELVTPLAQQRASIDARLLDLADRLLRALQLVPQ